MSIPSRITVGSGIAERVFPEPPSLAPLVARSMLRRTRTDAATPEVAYVLFGDRVDPARLAGYQRVCGFAHSARVPATFIHVRAFALATALMAGPDFPFPLLGLVHVANRMTKHRAVGVDEPLDLRVWAADLRDHPAGRQVDLWAQARVAGEIVWTGVSTYLHRSGPTTRRPQRPDTGPPAAPRAVWRLPADLGRRYAAVSGDHNPIHLSTWTAKAFGFPRAIAHGMWLNAHVLAVLEPRLPERFVVDVAFKTPALLPSTVAFDAERTATGDWTVGVRSARSGKPHLSATISSVPPES